MVEAGHTVSKPFGGMLKAHRIAQGLTQEELGRAADLSVRAIRNVERGRGRPRPGTVRRLTEALGLDASEIERLTAAARHVVRVVFDDDAGPDAQVAEVGVCPLDANGPTEIILCLSIRLSRRHFQN